MPEYQRSDDEIGVLWTKQGGHGEYLSGKIHDVAVVVFRNTKKQPGSKAPDWTVLKARPRTTAVDDDFGDLR